MLGKPDAKCLALHWCKRVKNLKRGFQSFYASLLSSSLMLPEFIIHPTAFPWGAHQTFHHLLTTVSLLWEVVCLLPFPSRVDPVDLDVFLSESREREKLNGICPNAFSLGTGEGNEMVKERLQASYINSCPIGGYVNCQPRVQSLSLALMLLLFGNWHLNQSNQPQREFNHLQLVTALIGQAELIPYDGWLLELSALIWFVVCA